MMYKTKRWTRRASAVGALAAAGALAFSGVAFADTIQDTIADTGTGVTLVAGSGTSGSGAIRLVANSAAGDPDPGCNIDAGENPLKLDIVTPAGVTANPDPLSITSCGTDFSVSFTASSSAVSGHVTVSILSGPAGGGTYVNQVDIPITVTHPNTKPSVSISGVASGANYVIGSVPTATCDVTDAEDGPSSFAAALSGTLTNGLGDQTATCNYTDKGGLAADTKTATYHIVAPPNTKPSVKVTGVTDGASYEIGSVPAAGCDVTDAEDGNSTKDAIVSGTLDHGLGSQTAACDYSDSGGLKADTATATYTVVDTHNPTISHTTSPSGGPDGANGWYVHPVKISFQCDDAGGSGVKDCTADQTLTDGANQSATGTATDWAGNTASDSVQGINVDSSAPNAPDASLDPQPNGAGWNNSNVKVHFASAGDIGPSGVDHCTPDATVDTEGASQTVSGTCTDAAGNVSAARVVTVKLDKTAPSISNTVTVKGTSGANGWYTSDVNVTFNATDGLSGVDGNSSPTVTSSGEGDSVQVQSPAFTDKAGNTTAAGVVTKTFAIDKTKPTNITFSGVKDYYFGDTQTTPGCNASDAVSGLASCVVSGGGSATGSQTWTAIATDKAGNQETATVNYTVLKWTAKGFYQPVDMSGVWNTVKGGSTVPMKFNVFAGPTELTSNSSVTSFTQKVVGCPSASAPTDGIEEVVTGGTALRYDTTGHQFIQNWQTPKKPGTCYTTTMNLQDGSTISANFALK